MSRKIVAIGGGENGRKHFDGTRYPYKLANQDKKRGRDCDLFFTLFTLF